MTIITVAAMLLASRLFFEPPVPGAGSAETGEALEGRVVEVLAEEELLVAEQVQPVQRVLVDITRGSLAGQRIEMLNGQATALTERTRVQPGDRVLLEHAVGPDGDLFYVTDFVRWPTLLGLTLLFGLAALAVGGWVGLRALISMGVSVAALAGFIIPGIMSGHDPLLVCMAGSLFLMTASLYLVYGWTWKTHVALAGLTISLVVSAQSKATRPGAAA